MFQINECRKVEIIQTFSHSNIRTLFKRLFAGDHRGVVTPVPIPNTEVKGPIAEGSAGLARARVGRRRQFFLAWRVFEGTKGTKGTEATAKEERSAPDCRSQLPGSREASRQTAASQWLGIS